MRKFIADPWTPPAETLQRGDEFIVRIDLPALEKPDMSVGIHDDLLVIQGNHGAGRFYRAFALPEGRREHTLKTSLRNLFEVVVKLGRR